MGKSSIFMGINGEMENMVEYLCLYVYDYYDNIYDI